MTIRSLQHFAFTVPKPDVGRRFYEAFGLEARADGDAVVLRRQGRDQDQVVLVPGAPKRLRHLSFGTHADELVALKGRLEANRVRLLDSPPVRGGEGLWFQDPDGLLLNVRVAEAAPWAASPEWRRAAARRGIRRSGPADWVTCFCSPPILTANTPST